MYTDNPGGDIVVCRIGKPYLTPEMTEQRIAKIREQALEEQRPLTCIILDDIPFTMWTMAEDLYDYLRDTLRVAIIVVLQDVDALRRPVQVGKLPWSDYATANLTANQAVSFVRHRVGLFRPGDLHKHLTDVGQDLFPFDEADIISNVAPPPGRDPDVPGTIPLRLLNKLLDKALGDALGASAPVPDLARLTSAELRERLISLKPAYEYELGRAA